MNQRWAGEALRVHRYDNISFTLVGTFLDYMFLDTESWLQEINFRDISLTF